MAGNPYQEGENAVHAHPDALAVGDPAVSAGGHLDYLGSLVEDEAGVEADDLSRRDTEVGVAPGDKLVILARSGECNAALVVAHVEEALVVGHVECL